MNVTKMLEMIQTIELTKLCTDIKNAIEKVNAGEDSVILVDVLKKLIELAYKAKENNLTIKPHQAIFASIGMRLLDTNEGFRVIKETETSKLLYGEVEK